MKKSIYIMLAAASLLVTSCNDFIEEENKVGETADLVYTSESGIEGLVASCYSFSRGWYGKEAGLGLSEMGTDLFYSGYDNKQKSLTAYNISSTSLEGNTANNPCLDHYWELFYQAINVCNTALEYVPKNTMIGEGTRSQYMGESYFLRAFYYFHVVNIWGAAPYYSTPASAMVSAPVRVSEEEIYSNILSDLDASIAAFDEAGYMTKAAGRANYWAAKALKARVLLYAASWLNDQKGVQIVTNQNYAGKNLYSLAKKEAEDVIGSGLFSFYSNYEDTWSMNNESVADNNEAIWGVTYSSDIATNVNCIPYRNKTNSSGEPLEYNSLITRTGYSRGGSAMLLMFVSMWNNGCSDLGGNGSKNTCVFVRSKDASSLSILSKLTNQNVFVADHYSPYGRGFTRYLPSLYLWDLLEKHAATDQRTEATLLSAYTIASPDLRGNAVNYPNLQDTAIYYCHLDGNSDEGLAMQAWAKDRYRIQFAYNGDIPVYSSGDCATALPTEAAKVTSDVYGDGRYNNTKIGGWCSYPGIKKFLDNVYNETYPTHDISSRDAVVFRLAEMYLIKAECELNTGGDAMATINQLRSARAIAGTDNTLSGTADIETILEERAVELCGEQQRWFDLKRTGKLVDHVKIYNAQGAGQIQPYHVYRPIPEVEFQSITNAGSAEFTQNEGYSY